MIRAHEIQTYKFMLLKSFDDISPILKLFSTVNHLRVWIETLRTFSISIKILIMAM